MGDKIHGRWNSQGIASLHGNLFKTSPKLSTFYFLNFVLSELCTVNCENSVKEKPFKNLLRLYQHSTTIHHSRPESARTTPPNTNFSVVSFLSHSYDDDFGKRIG